jgi:FAD/FMN-containing dehydrogenase
MDLGHRIPKEDVIKIRKHLAEIVGEGHVVTDPQELQNIGKDWTKLFPVCPSIAVLPRTTDEVSKIMAYCHQHKYPVVPSGGRTGLAAGAVASAGEIVVSLGRMNRILKVDSVGLSIEAEAGVTTQALQEAAAAAGFYFALDLAAKGSCHIGGNIATNAGGLKLIRYGGTREQILGIEVVLANGEILDLNYRLRKNNTGYDLKQLFLGSEGTLGIVTKATLKMVAKPRNVQLACLGMDGFTNVLNVMKEINLNGLQVTAFEFFTRQAHEIVLKHFPQIKSPFANRAEIYVLLEVEEGLDSGKVLEPFLEKILEKELILDGVLAQSSSEFRDLWSLRENITESIQAQGHVRKNDIALPIDRLGEYIDEMMKVVSEGPKSIQVLLFGHLGDGNLHLNYVGDFAMDVKVFQKIARETEEKVFALLPKYRGSISAEHGIGMLKKHDLHFSRSELEINIMKSIKALLDPAHILNPGKIF